MNATERNRMNKKINIPNLLSGLRILTIPLIVHLIINSNRRNFPVLITLYFFSILLDFFDGYLARRLSQETDLGKLLDPLADKLMVSCTVVALLIKTNFPLWLAVLIITRDVLILVGGTLMFRGRHFVATSVMSGKTAFVSMGILLLVYILDLSKYVDLEILKRFFIVITISFMAWSWIEYLQVYLRKKNDDHK